MRKLELPTPADLWQRTQRVQDEWEAKLLDELSNLFVDLPAVLQNAAAGGKDCVRIRIKRTGNDGCPRPPATILSWDVGVAHKYDDNLVKTYLGHLMDQATAQGYNVRSSLGEEGQMLVFIGWQGVTPAESAPPDRKFTHLHRCLNREQFNDALARGLGLCPDDCDMHYTYTGYANILSGVKVYTRERISDEDA